VDDREPLRCGPAGVANEPPAISAAFNGRHLLHRRARPRHEPFELFHGLLLLLAQIGERHDGFEPTRRQNAPNCRLVGALQERPEDRSKLNRASLLVVLDERSQTGLLLSEDGE